ncbi:MAG: paar repeat-containing protein [Burkholderiaceae bacterium]
MTDPADLHPNAPRGGGGPGHFRSARVAGQNPHIDRHLRPGPLGHTDHKGPDPALRKAENEAYLAKPNVKAFLDMIAWAEGGDYDLKYGGVVGRKNDKWRITDFSLPPGPGADGSTTASGRYQINVANWTENGKKKMGITDFSPHSQDLIAVEGLRQVHAIDAVLAGDMDEAIPRASRTWNSLPQGKDKGNRVAGQHYVSWNDAIAKFQACGGTLAGK